MDHVNKTLYIPLYGKAYVSKKNIILRDKKAEEIWEKEAFTLKGKSRSKWLAYYMAIRAAVYDDWVQQNMIENPDAVVLHIGCGLDSRVERISAKGMPWYDIDFPEVMKERRKYYVQSDCYDMLPVDMRTDEWKTYISAGQDAIILMEGVSMYFKPEELTYLLSNLAQHFNNVKILMDCYTTRAAIASKYKNPINDVGVKAVYGYDDAKKLALSAGLTFVKEHNMTPPNYIDELQGLEKRIFQKLYAGKIAKALYRMYEFQKDKS